MVRFTIYYTDKPCNEVGLVKDKMFNTIRYVNFTKGHICRCLFPNIGLAIKDLEKYPNIDSIEYDGIYYNLETFIKIFVPAEEIV